MQCCQFSTVQRTQNTTHEQEDTVIQHSKKESIFARSKYIRWKNDGRIDIPHRHTTPRSNLKSELELHLDLGCCRPSVEL